MSRTRDGLNTAALRLLGGRPPIEVPQPLAVAAAGCGGGGEAGATSPWSHSEVVEATLTAGNVYYLNGSTWTALSPTVATRAVTAVCTAYVNDDPDLSTLLFGGVFARTGTAGVPLFAGASGAITETLPGDSDDETTEAPWVWPIGWQITGALAIFLPCDPYRPRLISYCLADGETQLEIITREYPPDPGA